MNPLSVSCMCACARATDDSSGGARAVAEVVQNFITAMDSLKLNLVAVDQVGRGGGGAGDSSLYAIAKSSIGPAPQPVTKNRELEQNTGCLWHV